MAAFTVGGVLGALRVVGPIIAAAPEFKALYDGVVQTFDKETDQQTLKNAYDVAVSGATNAHTQLQDMVRRHS